MITINSLISGERRRWVALAVVCMGQLMMVLDATIVNVALPSMQRDLGFSQANLAWVIDAYMIAFGSFLLLAGRLGDLLGRKRMFLGGLVIFTLASMACGIADDQILLIVARFIQGLGGAVASAAVLALLAVFVVVESRLENPMFPLRILRVPGLAASSMVRAFLVTGMFSTFLLGVLYLQHVRGYGALETGLAFLPLTLIMGVMSVGVTARLMGRFGPIRVLLVGLTAIAAALVLLSQLPAHASYFPTIFVPFALLGLGAGMSFLPLMTIAMAEVPLADAGLASGIVNASLQISAAIGIAALGTVAAERTKVLAGLGEHHVQALTGGFHLAWAIGAGTVLVGALIALVWLRSPARPAEELVELREDDPVSFELEAA